MVELVIRNKRQGRAIQSKLAKMTGGKSVGTIEGQDISYLNKPWSVEAKHRKTFIGNKFMEQAEKNAPKEKTPIVIVHTKNQRMMKSLVLIRLGDWIDWYGKLEGEGDSNTSNTEDQANDDRV
jgi:hypothetical protein